MGSLHTAQLSTLASVAAGLWGLGAVLYVLLMVVILLRLLVTEIAPEQLTPPFWITMRATAITVLAAARILNLRTHLAIPAETLSGLAFALWAFWWIPLLVVLGI